MRSHSHLAAALIQLALGVGMSADAERYVPELYTKLTGLSGEERVHKSIMDVVLGIPGMEALVGLHFHVPMQELEGSWVVDRLPLLRWWLALSHQSISQKGKSGIRTTRRHVLRPDLMAHKSVRSN